MEKKFIKEGTYGICYELLNGDILKIFKVPKSLGSIKKFEYFKKYQNESIVFPKKFIVQNNQFKGYITKKVEGLPFNQSLMTYNIEDIYNHVISVEKDIDLISKGRIRMIDIHSNNVFYDGNKIGIFDPDRYQISHINPEDLFYINIRELKKLILEIIFNKILTTNLKNKQAIYTELRKYFLNDYEINQLLLEYKIILEKYYQREIIKFEDIGDNNGYMYSRTYGRREN